MNVIVKQTSSNTGRIQCFDHKGAVLFEIPYDQFPGAEKKALDQKEAKKQAMEIVELLKEKNQFLPSRVAGAFSVLHKLREKEQELTKLVDSPASEEDPEKDWIAVSWMIELQLVKANIENVENQITSNQFDF